MMSLNAEFAKTSKIERAAGCLQIEFNGQFIEVEKMFYVGDTICAR